MTSIRRRVLWAVLGLLISVNAFTAFTVWHDSRHEIDEIYDAQLVQNARLIRGIYGRWARGYGPRDASRFLDHMLERRGQRHHYERNIVFQVWDRDGRLLARSSDAPELRQMPIKEGFSVLHDDGDWRVFAMRDDRHQMTIWVAERGDVRKALGANIVGHIVVPVVIGVVGLIVFISWAIGWGLRPLKQMANTIVERSPDALDPLDIKPLPAELAPVQTALNRLFVQISDVLSRERRFIADAAHELRTPLAILRIHAQNAAATMDSEARERALQFLIQGVDRCTRLVGQLLVLARMQPLEHTHPEQIDDLATVVRQELADLSVFALERNVEVELNADDGDYRMPLHSGSIGILLQNLVTNALNFSKPGDVIHVTLERQCQQIVLSVEDQGPGIEESLRERVFERFVSQGEHHGAGLGLAIVSAIVAQHDARITLDNRAEGGLKVTIVFPVRTVREDPNH